MENESLHLKNRMKTRNNNNIKTTGLTTTTNNVEARKRQEESFQVKFSEIRIIFIVNFW